MRVVKFEESGKVVLTKCCKLNGFAWGLQVLMNVELDLRRLAVECRKWHSFATRSLLISKVWALVLLGKAGVTAAHDPGQSSRTLHVFQLGFQFLVVLRGEIIPAFHNLHHTEAFTHGNPSYLFERNFSYRMSLVLRATLWPNQWSHRLLQGLKWKIWRLSFHWYP